MTTTPQVRPAPAGNNEPSANRIVEYLQGVRDELKKAQWPDREEMIQLTKVVLVIIAVVAAFCGALDGLLSLITSRLFSN